MSTENNQAGADKRQDVRTPMSARIKLFHDEFGELEVHSSDLSDGGVFILLKPNKVLSVGQVIKFQVQDLPIKARIVETEVVRLDDEGVGLKFLGQR